MKPKISYKTTKGCKRLAEFEPKSMEGSYPMSDTCGSSYVNPYKKKIEDE